MDTTTYAGESMVTETVQSIRTALGVDDVRVSLTPTGERIVGRLGARWVVAAVRALHLAHPSRPLELMLVASDSEPLPKPWPLQTGADGAMFGQHGAVGRISVGATGDEPVQRTLHVPSEAVLDGQGGFSFLPGTSLKRRLVGGVYTRLYSRSPLALDEWRQRRNSWVERRRGSARPLGEALTTAGPAAGTTSRPVAWFALHWFEPGGAESWAFQAAEAARDAGFDLVMTADVGAPQRLIDRALELTDDVYLVGNVLAHEDMTQFITGLLRRHEPTLLHIHHSTLAYGSLADVKHLRPELYVVDSVHIVEHRTGGFVRRSIEASPFIDRHHVISPELRDLYLMDADVAADKVDYHPLTDGRVPEQAVTRAPGEVLTVGFLGRLAPQKRPFLFVELARRLHKAAPGQFRFVLQGSGGLTEITEAHIARAGLSDVIERRAWGPVETFLDDVDVLVVSSDNEGLTLTSLEAETHGVLVLSADVGSQRTVVASSMVVPREPRGFLTGATRALRALTGDRGRWDAVRSEQSDLVRSLASVEPAVSYLNRVLDTLKKESF